MAAYSAARVKRHDEAFLQLTQDLANASGDDL
jgi:hypothetical protein